MAVGRPPWMTMSFTLLLGVSLSVYVLGLLGVSWWVRGRIQDAEDYLVAGRRLSLWLAGPALFATWFGAGTLLTATDEVRAEGLVKAALDPFGAGLCLIVAGAFYARPLWRLRLLTLPDYYRRRFGPRAELVCGVIMVPGYFGWVAAQFVALAGILELFFGLELSTGILLVALVGMTYTIIGGMWSVTVTDCAQATLLVLGLVVVAMALLSEVGGGSVVLGWTRLATQTPAAMLAPVPAEAAAFVAWLGVLAAGALGNIPGQDLMQRVFAARSERIAHRACLWAGAAYLVFGCLPLLIGLASNLIPGTDVDRSIVPVVAQLLLDPWVSLLFVLALVSAVLSTIDSGILAPASVLAQNVVGPRLAGRFGRLSLNRLAVVVVTTGSVGFAYLGEDAYALLETAYEIGLVALFVPLTFGMYLGRGDERAAVASMVVGTLVWAAHLALGWDSFLQPITAAWAVPPPMGLSSTALGAMAYLAACATRPATATA